MDKFVAQPVVTSRVIETNFILRPRTVEDARSENILLDQQRNANVYKTLIHMSILSLRSLIWSTTVQHGSVDTVVGATRIPAPEPLN